MQQEQIQEFCDGGVPVQSCETNSRPNMIVVTGSIMWLLMLDNGPAGVQGEKPPESLHFSLLGDFSGRKLWSIFMIYV